MVRIRELEEVLDDFRGVSNELGGLWRQVSERAFQMSSSSFGG